ncbi:putative Mannose-specific lectin 3 [Cocos nucifera]|uniref:Putative Mannose-specific lectin 3 n=1 Tax=Cocos nucifera TaxID=13894 RepID=A0A8K0MZP1_COCNU|nr:putative Mannose-specific lectin 3 [Cocos nucifera]
MSFSPATFSPQTANFPTKMPHSSCKTIALALNDLGQFVIKEASGSAVWTSALRGNYTRGTTKDETISTQLMEVPTANNLLFSSQVIYDDAQLTTRDYTFIMRESCNLALAKRSAGIIWQTGTVDGGEYCFLRLDHRGQLAIVDDQYKTVWRSQPASKDGDYVLVVQINGQAIVYGPVVWSTTYG